MRTRGQRRSAECKPFWGFEQELARLAPQMLRFACFLCRSRDDAEDITQEALAKVGLSINQLREPARLKPWAFRIVHNAYRMRLRALALRSGREVALDAARTGSGYGARYARDTRDPALLPDEAYFWAETRRVITRAIKELPDIYRTVIVLRDLKGYSTNEAAEILSISSDVVKTRLHRGHVQLRESLHRSGVRRSGWTTEAEDVREQMGFAVN